MADYPTRDAEGRCIFCSIVSGKATTPGIFWEDEKHLAFLAIDPNTEGFSCVIPKEHRSSDILKMDEVDLAELMSAAKKVAAVIEAAFEDVGRVGFVGEGTGVDHAHLKLIPMHGTQFLKNGSWHQISSNKELWFDRYEGWLASAAGPKAAPEDLAKLAEKLRSIAEFSA